VTWFSGPGWFDGVIAAAPPARILAVVGAGSLENP